MPTILPLPDSFLQNKQGWITASHKILNHYQQESTIEGIGKSVDLWRLKKDVIEIEMVNGLGFLLGDLIITEHSGHWVLVEDQHGTTPAICKTEHGMLTFALDCVSKRLRDTASRAEKELRLVADTFSTNR